MEQFQQRGHPAVHFHQAGTGLQDARHDLQHGALAGPVFADDAEGFAAPDLAIDIVEGPKIAMALQAVEGQQLLEPVARSVVNGVTLRNPLEANGVHGRRKTSVTVESYGKLKEYPSG
jgi:hypothetical protein